MLKIITNSIKSITEIFKLFIYRCELLRKYDCLMGPHCKLKNIKKIKLEENVRIGSHVIIDGKSNSKIGIEIGKDAKIMDFAILSAHGGHIKIGSNCSIQYYSVLYGMGGLVIGNNVRIAAHVVIIPMQHIYEDRNIPIYQQGEKAYGIVIEDDVWIGSGVKVLDGVTIGKGSVIGAGAVVTTSIPQYSVAVGVPARVIKSR